MEESPTVHNPGGDLPVTAVVTTERLEPEVCFLPMNRVPYTAELAAQVLDLYAGGTSLAKIARLPGMPPVASLYRWHRENEDFRSEISKAKRTRALVAEEKASEIAETAESLDKDSVPGARLAFDIHKWGSEVNDPETYGKRTTIQGDQSRPIVFQVISHIPARDPEPHVIEVGKAINHAELFPDEEPPPDAA